MTPKEKAAELLSMFEQETMPFHEVLIIAVVVIIGDLIAWSFSAELLSAASDIAVIAGIGLTLATIYLNYLLIKKIKNKA